MDCAEVQPCPRILAAALYVMWYEVLIVPSTSTPSMLESMFSCLFLHGMKQQQQPYKQSQLVLFPCVCVFPFFSCRLGDDRFRVFALSIEDQTFILYI